MYEVHRKSLQFVAILLPALLPLDVLACPFKTLLENDEITLRL